MKIIGGKSEGHVWIGKLIVDWPVRNGGGPLLDGCSVTLVEVERDPLVVCAAEARPHRLDDGIHVCLDFRAVIDACTSCGGYGGTCILIHDGSDHGRDSCSSAQWRECPTCQGWGASKKVHFGGVAIRPLRCAVGWRGAKTRNPGRWLSWRWTLRHAWWVLRGRPRARVRDLFPVHTINSSPVNYPRMVDGFRERR